MDTLTGTGSRKAGLLLLFVLMVLPGLAQDYKALQEAFAASYEYESKADFTKATEVLRKVYDEKSYEINLRLGWVTYKNGLFTESSAYYQKAINLKPYAIEPKLGYTYPASSLGNWDQVKTQYLEVLKIDPLHSATLYKLGLIYYGRADYTNAFKYFEKLANLFPFDYDSIIMFAWSNYRVGKFREAKVLFNKALLMKPGDSSALEGLSLIK